MHVLFVHKNFPAQFGHIAAYLIKQKGYRCTFDVQVASAAMDPSAIEPNATGRVVIGFKMPDQQRGQQFTVGLREKNGSRHVQLDNLAL